MTCIEGLDYEISDEGYKIPKVHKHISWNGRDIQCKEGQSSSLDMLGNISSPPSLLGRCSQIHEEESDEDFVIANAPFTPSTDHEYATLEERLSAKGFALYSDQPTEIMACRSIMGHVKSCTKKLKKLGKKVKEYIEEHKKEILLGALVLGAATGATLLLLAASSSSTTTALGVGVAAAASRKKEEEDTPPFRGSDSKKDRSPRSVPQIPPLNNTPLAASAPRLESLAPYASTLPPNEASVFMNNLFKNMMDAASKPINLYPIEPKNSVPPPLSPIASPDSSSVSRQESSPGIISRFVDTICRGFETIGRGMSEPELLNRNSPLDIFHKEPENQPAVSTPPSCSEEIPEQSSSPGILSTVIDKIRNGLETIGRGMSEPDLAEIASSFGSNPKMGAQKQREITENPITHPDSPLDKAPSVKSDFISSLEEVGKKMGYSWNTKTISRELLPAYRLLSSSEVSPSRSYKIEGNEIEGMRVTCTNGMNNTLDFAKSNARYIQSLHPANLSINGIYNHTNGPVLDLLEIVACNYVGSSPVTAELLVEEWSEFHEKNIDKPFQKCLHFCHSQGAINTINALESLPKEKQLRVIVIAIGPAKVVPKELCYQSFNYASKNDFVPYGEVLHGSFRSEFLSDEERAALLQEIIKNQSAIIWLEPHEKATFLDHEVTSLTYLETIKDHLKDYVLHQGEYK